MTDEQARRVNYNTHTSVRSIMRAVSIPAETLSGEQRREVHFYVFIVPFLHCCGIHKFCNSWTLLLQSCIDTSQLVCWCNASKIAEERRRIEQRRKGASAAPSEPPATASGQLPRAAHCLELSQLGRAEDFEGYSTTLQALEREVLSAEEAALLEPPVEDNGAATTSAEAAAAAAAATTSAEAAAEDATTQPVPAPRPTAPAATAKKYLGKVPDMPRYVRGKDGSTIDLVSNFRTAIEKRYPPDSLVPWANCLTSNPCENHNGNVCTVGWDKHFGANILGYRMVAQHAAASLFSSDNAEFAMLARQNPAGTFKAMREGAAPPATASQADAARHARAVQMASRTSARSVQDNPYSNVMGFKMPAQPAISSEARFHTGQASAEQLLKLQAQREKEFAGASHSRYRKAPVADPPGQPAAAQSGGSEPAEGSGGARQRKALGATADAAAGSSGTKRKRQAADAPADAAAGSNSSKRKRMGSKAADADASTAADAAAVPAAAPPRPRRQTAAAVVYAGMGDDDVSSDFDTEMLSESEDEQPDSSESECDEDRSAPPHKRRKVTTQPVPPKGKAARQKAAKLARKAGLYRGKGRGADSGR
jgi:hypothetical protein